VVVWTGREAIGWGGGCCGDAFANGLAYNPATNSYRELAPSPLAPSQHPIGAWTGRELVLFSSGINPAEDKPYPASYARAAAYNPATDTWRRIDPLPSSGRGFGGAAAWDGHEVLIAGDGASARAAFAYDPSTNTRRALALMPIGVPNASAFWTGRRLIVWGGSEAGRGLSYDPAADRWSVLPPAPVRGFARPMAWIGDSLVVGGGFATPSRRVAAFTPTG
jgi:N-acetylneuraminic acid mutarotase